MIKETIKPNRLSGEKSPYLLQHAGNPVDWWPWCDEAFAKAAAEDKPVFLSVGYSTCHWCHVMERESFEDREVADILNGGFISIKLDREERPDIDSVYMNVTQMLTGGGGWPMSVFMDCEKRPFYAGTYFPKHDGRHGPGFITLLTHLSGLWKNDRPRLMSAASEIIAGLTEPDRKKDIDYSEAVQRGFRQLQSRFDPGYGGFGGAPKFPTPHNLLLLLRYHYVYRDPESLQMAEKTLVSIYRGGLRDHVGFGFSRYSTDKRWLAPHFEKMLYDNALLASAFAEAFLITKNPFYRRAAEEIFEYVARDMTSPEGAFYSAEDADSEGEEGLFYTFTKREVISALGAADGERFCREYDITDTGNFEGRNIPNLIENENFAEIIRDEFFAGCLRRLFDYRAKRVRPLRDDKVLASWNGLMIYALAYAGRAFGDAGYIRMAASAADFILSRMKGADGRLFTRYRDGEARFPGVAEDYAFVVMGLIELYQASFTERYLTEAHRLNQILIEDFYDDGALYQTGKGADALISRPRELYDGAMPSYNSVSIMNFTKLSHLCDAPELLGKAEGIVRFFGTDIEAMPSAFSFALCGMMALDGKQLQLSITGDNHAELLGIINSAYGPFTTLRFAGTGDKTAVYLCEGTHCEAPIRDADTLRRRLER